VAESAAAARAVLEGATIADLVERETRDAGIAMYQIERSIAQGLWRWGRTR
jgi:hypothetical protein